MMTRFLPIAFILALSATSLTQGLPPLGSPQEQKPAGPPPLGASADQKPTTTAPPSSLSVDAANADLKTARAANQEKRYADAESLMSRDTAARPAMPYLWLELAQAQVGQKKYAEAEVSYKAALTGGESASQKQAPAGAFYTEGKGTVAHVSVSSAAPPPKGGDTHEIQGLANSGLGEVFIRQNRIPEGKEAFDKAATANPTQAALYLRNETILFLQIGNAVEQVEAANKAIVVDPTRAALYFFKGQGLAAQATVDPTTQKLALSAGCADALQKYLDMEPTGQYWAEAKAMLTAAGVPIKAGKK